MGDRAIPHTGEKKKNSRHVGAREKQCPKLLVWFSVAQRGSDSKTETSTMRGKNMGMVNHCLYPEGAMFKFDDVKTQKSL